jgi:hypothetical protein
MTIDVALVLVIDLGVPLPLLLYQGGRGYKKGNRVGYNMISIRTLSLLTYFTYMTICALGSSSWSFEIFSMMDRVISDLSLGHLSPWGVVPQVLILVSSPRVLGKWVDVGWSWSSSSVMKLLSTQFTNQVPWLEITECSVSRTECFFAELIE